MAQGESVEDDQNWKRDCHKGWCFCESGKRISGENGPPLREKRWANGAREEDLGMGGLSAEEDPKTDVGGKVEGMPSNAVSLGDSRLGGQPKGDHLVHLLSAFLRGSAGFGTS